MMQGGRDADFDEATHQLLRSVEIDGTVVVGTPGELARITFGGSFDEYALAGADHALADLPGAALELALDCVQSSLFGCMRRVVVQLGCRCSGTRAVEKAET